MPSRVLIGTKGSPMNPNYMTRGFRANDTNDLIDIDLKCFVEGWSPEEWNKRSYDASYGITIATYYGNPVGFILFKQGLAQAIEIVKLAVKREHRLRGVSRDLLTSATAYAITKQATSIAIVIPENQVTLSGDNNLTPWLKKLRFKAETPFLKDHFRLYGELEDGVRFSCPISLREIDAA